MYHKNAVAGDVHIIHNWAVANAAALAALVTGPTDIGKIAKQIDTGDFLILTDTGWTSILTSADAPSSADITRTVNEQNKLRASGKSAASPIFLYKNF